MEALNVVTTYYMKMSVYKIWKPKIIVYYSDEIYFYYYLNLLISICTLSYSRIQISPDLRFHSKNIHVAGDIGKFI